MQGSFSISFDKKGIAAFDAACQVSIKSLFTGTKKATEASCREIYENSLKQVPKNTMTLADSAFYEVSRRTDIASYRFSGVVGYGGNGDPVNPKTGKRASYYMVAVHERLDVVHPNGKAKYLEDPVREFAARNFHRTVFKYAQESLAALST